MPDSAIKRGSLSRSSPRREATRITVPGPPASSGQALPAPRGASSPLGRRRPGQGRSEDRRGPHVQSLPSHREESPFRQQRFPRQQQDQAPLAAEPARAPLLGAEREPLDQPSR